MNLQPSAANSTDITRRQLFAAELATGGHGQVPLSGAGTFYPTNSTYAFYEIDFLTNTVMTSAAFRTLAEDNITTNYAVNSAGYINFPFPAAYKWFAPLNSITLASGTGIAFEYKLFAAPAPCCQQPLW